MKSVSYAASGLALTLGMLAAMAPAAEAQIGAQASQPAPARQFRLTKQERAALAPLQVALAAKDAAGAAAALPAAQAGATSADARFILARLQFQLALDTRNAALQSQAIDALIASGPTAAELPRLLQNQAALATFAGNRQRAESALTRLIEIEPNNAEALKDLARIKIDQRKPAEAVPLLDRSISLSRAAGQRVPESWYEYNLRLATDLKLPVASKLGRDLAAAYPSAENWRDAILTYVDVARPTTASMLDAWRLMRATKSLAGERDYLALAEAADGAGLPAEAKVVLDEGVSRKMVDPTKSVFKELLVGSAKRAAAERAGLAGRQAAGLAPTATGVAALTAADASFGQADYPKAAALYRAAIQKGGIDTGSAGTRLGMALGLAGQRAEAETALQAVAGPSADLAQLWLVWFRQPA